MLDKKVFLRICLLVLAGILCSACSQVLTTAAPTQETQPGLYRLEDALTLAVGTLQADSQIAIASKTSKPDNSADTPVSIITEPPESEDTATETDLPTSGDNGEGTSPSVENPEETETPEGEGNGNTDERLADRQVIGTVDPTLITSFHIPVSGSCPDAYQCIIDCPDPNKCKEIDPILDSRVYGLRYDLTVPIPPPAITVKRDESEESEESEESGESEEGSTEQSHGIEIPPISIDPPGLPPLPPIQPPIIP